MYAALADKDAAGVDEGMEGISTRFAFKALSATFNHDTEEVAADPVHLISLLAARNASFSAGVPMVTRR